MDIHRKVVEFIDSGVSFAAAVVLRADGSTPQKAGARALIDAAGRIFGTVGGGLVEAEARRRAIEACRSKRPDVFDFNLDDAHATDGGPICGGSMRILIDPTAAKDRACHAQATDALRQRRRGVLLTSVHSAPPPEVTTMRWFAEDEIPADAGFPGADAVRCCLAGETPRLFVRDSASSEGGSEVLVEPVVPKPRLLIVDEPMVGLDPHGARQIKDVFRSIAASGRTVFLSTHTLVVAQEVCHRIGIINQGRLVALGTVQELRVSAASGDDDLESVFMRIVEEAAANEHPLSGKNQSGEVQA